MRKSYILCMGLTLLLAVSLFAQHNTEVLLKFSDKEDLMRIVFESKESIINSAKIMPSASEIRIEFSEPFILKNLKDLPFELVLNENMLTVNLKEKGEIRFFRLSSPARLVFDIKKSPSSKLIQPNIFVIDAGHGGYDFGITHENVSEKDIILTIAKELSKLLSKKGKKAFLTRKVDQHVSITDRNILANQKRPDVFISLHTSLSKNIVLYSTKLEEHELNNLTDIYALSSSQRRYIEQSKALLESIAVSFKEGVEVTVFSAEMPLPILNSSSAPAVLIEFPSPQFMNYDKETRAKLVQLLSNGIMQYDKAER
jgi:N-acetylmuramoyl-L-alanine amidase